jgi:glutathione peroxidase
MKYLAITLVVASFALLAMRVSKVLGQNIVTEPSTVAATKSPLDFTVKDIDGNDYNLAQLKGKVVMIVNVASKCGLTPQYEGLEKLYKTYKDRGFVIVGFPANNFNSQEPGSNEQIKEFCTSKYNVTFPMMSKISVKGDDKHPLYKLLTEDSGDFKGDIGWNFTKFLIDKNGTLYARFASRTKPDDEKVITSIEKALDAKPAQ